jgi:hypothetical protein
MAGSLLISSVVVMGLAPCPKIKEVIAVRNKLGGGGIKFLKE